MNNEVGLDIKGVLEEIGTSFTYLVRPDSGELGTQYLDYEMNRQVTKPFIREYFLEAMFPYDTDAVGGDVIRFSDGRVFMVMNITDENLFDESLGKEAVLYKCNVSGELRRASGEAGWDAQTYQRSTVWETIAIPAYGLLSEKLFGTDLEQDADFGQISLEAQILYLPNSYGAKVLDRYSPKSGEYYKIQAIRTREYDAVDTCHVVEDTR